MSHGATRTDNGDDDGDDNGDDDDDADADVDDDDGRENPELRNKDFITYIMASNLTTK